MIKINKYKHPKDPNIIETISIDDYVNYIKNGYNKNDIIEARKYGKGTPIYEKIKLNRNAVTINFLFNKYKLNKNIIKPTGLLFFDIDDETFNPEELNNDLVYISHKSFGGKGYSIIVKVDNTPNIHNKFKTTYLSIAKQIGIEKYIDIMAIKMSQFTIISYDPNIYVNKNAPILQSKEIYVDDIFEEDYTNEIFIETEEDNKWIKKLKFQKELDRYDEDCVFIEEGLTFYKCYLPWSKKYGVHVIKDGEKHQLLTSYINNLIILNPGISRKQCYSIISTISTKYCQSKVSKTDLMQIVMSKMNKKLSPERITQKYYWINPKCKNKNKVLSKKKISISSNKIEKFFEEKHDTKITQKYIALKTGLNISTIKRRLTSVQKDLIKSLNKEYKKRIQCYRIE